MTKFSHRNQIEIKNRGIKLTFYYKMETKIII